MAEDWLGLVIVQREISSLQTIAYVVPCLSGLGGRTNEQRGKEMISEIDREGVRRATRSVLVLCAKRHTVGK